jgi:predicted transposase YbfD/YdcC
MFKAKHAPGAGGGTTLYVACASQHGSPKMDTLWWFDGQQTWHATGLRATVPALAVVVHPTDPNTVFVGTTVGVYRGTLTHPAGSDPLWTFTRLNNGLPEVAVQDLAFYRDPPTGTPTMLLLPAATQSRGAWEVDLLAPKDEKTYLPVHDLDTRRRPITPLAKPMNSAPARFDPVNTCREGSKARRLSLLDEHARVLQAAQPRRGADCMINTGRRKHLSTRRSMAPTSAWPLLSGWRRADTLAACPGGLFSQFNVRVTGGAGECATHLATLCVVPQRSPGDGRWSGLGPSIGHRGWRRERGHGRRETRTIKAVTIQTPGGLSFPHAQQAVRITRTRSSKGKTTREMAYLVASLPAEHAQPTDLGTWARSEWHIEDRVHYVRDVTLREDAHQARTGNGPAVFAALRNTSIRLPPQQRPTQHRPRHQTRQPPPQRPHRRRDHDQPNYAIALPQKIRARRCYLFGVQYNFT